MSLNRQYSIEMYYRNDTSKDPYLLPLPGCTSSCPLQKFAELVSSVITENWSKECGKKDKMKGSVTACWKWVTELWGCVLCKESCGWQAHPSCGRCKAQTAGTHRARSTHLHRKTEASLFLRVCYVWGHLNLHGRHSMQLIHPDTAVTCLDCQWLTADNHFLPEFYFQGGSEGRSNTFYFPIFPLSAYIPCFADPWWNSSFALAPHGPSCPVQS